MRGSKRSFKPKTPPAPLVASKAPQSVIGVPVPDGHAAAIEQLGLYLRTQRVLNELAEIANAASAFAQSKRAKALPMAPCLHQYLAGLASSGLIALATEMELASVRMQEQQQQPQQQTTQPKAQQDAPDKDAPGGTDAAVADNGPQTGQGGQQRPVDDEQVSRSRAGVSPRPGQYET